MFEFVKQVFLSEIMFFGCNLSNLNSLKYISMSMQKYKVRPENININSDEATFYPYSVKVNKCSGSCNSIRERTLSMYKVGG